MKIVEYYKSQNQEHWMSEIGKGDWSAAELLSSLLKADELRKICGKSAEVYLLTDNDKLASFAVLAEQDEIDVPEMSPWIGFVYTFPKYRGQHHAGKLIKHICALLKEGKTKNVYISTEEIGLYEKYGFSYLKMMMNREGKPTRVYVKPLN